MTRAIYMHEGRVVSARHSHHRFITLPRTVAPRSSPPRLSSLLVAATWLSEQCHMWSLHNAVYVTRIRTGQRKPPEEVIQGCHKVDGMSRIDPSGHL